MNDIRRALDRVWLASERRRWQRGILGRKNSDGLWEVGVDARPDFVWVSLGPDGSQGVSMARNVGRVPLRATLPVRLRDEGGVLSVEGEDYSGGLLEDDAGANEYGVLPHPHALEALSDVTLTTPAVGSLLQFDGTAWVDASVGLNQLSDVDFIDFFADADLLYYQSGLWTNRPAAEVLVEAISAGAEIVTPVDADRVPLINSIGNVLSFIRWDNLKAALDGLVGSLYAVLLGSAGGQTLHGGTAANEDLTLHGTSHATRTSSTVQIQPSGGGVSIGSVTNATGVVHRSAGHGLGSDLFKVFAGFNGIADVIGDTLQPFPVHVALIDYIAVTEGVGGGAVATGQVVLLSGATSSSILVGSTDSFNLTLVATGRLALATVGGSADLTVALWVRYV